MSSHNQYYYQWFEEIPLDWEYKKIKFLTTLRNEKINENTELPYVGLENIESKTGMYFGIDSTNNVEVEGISNKFYENDVLFGKLRPYLAKCILSDFEGICTTELLVMKVKEQKLSEKYLKYLLLSPKFIDLVNSSTYGSKMPRANWGFIKNIEIPVPELAVQKRIENFIENKTIEIDELIVEKEQLIQLLEEKRQSIITEAVTKGLNPNVKMKDSGVEWIDEIPEQWEKTRLDFIARVKARLGWKGLKADEYVDKGYIFLSTPNLKSRNIDFENVNYITEERYVESPEIMLEKGDVLLAKDGSTLGITNVVRELPSKATVNSSIAVLRPKELIDSIYFYYYLSSTYIQDIINQIKGGMGVPHLFQADIKKFPVILPPLCEQKEIAKYIDEQVENLDSLIETIKVQIQNLKDYRQSLIYEAVTGKIDVRDFEVKA
ncbi:restriction endonuclease subunit S [Bacillus thuringiensis]|uniref:Uncharacterized protein n=1 Tax=Bacillus thuringiensis TaxID=1428 RepID=A0A9W3T9R1_BACTU|nr:restriction endonuclease subunit S [Bacillus thuringiensis]AQY37368.1 hypothetical protein B4918_04865 [Bacillus thuringiensis]MDR4150595.1 restriction endonuclease subunit S [Bacillus thuringiensis]MEC3574064.1 restriction endonuclease subunit S [Bacillus thuringiensis]MED2019696.1 restriction endonuclease subunit S [Bacillus thuringiensis]MED2142235.1 restriction endonuclease subunit S [Bacillus thuringiensis]